MNTINNSFADLAHWLLLGATNADDIAEQNADLIGDSVEAYSPLDDAVAVLEGGNLLGAVAHLDAAIKLTLKPVTPPATGRNKLERFQFATEQRDSLRRTAQIARVLVLDGIKASPPAVTASDRPRATSASQHPIQGA